jgi:hypothetical protein
MSYGFSYQAYGSGTDPKPVLEEYDNRLVVNLGDDISLVAETMDELSEGLSLILDDTG